MYILTNTYRFQFKSKKLVVLTSKFFLSQFGDCFSIKNLQNPFRIPNWKFKIPKCIWNILDRKPKTMKYKTILVDYRVKYDMNTDVSKIFNQYFSKLEWKMELDKFLITTKVNWICVRTIAEPASFRFTDRVH